MKNFKSPMVDDRGQVACGTYLDKAMHKGIVEWCEKRNIALDKFIRVATYHFWFSLTGMDEARCEKVLFRFQGDGGHHHSWGGR